MDWIPDGAQITGMGCYIYDTNTTYDPDVYLHRVREDGSATYDLIVSVTTAANAGWYFRSNYSGNNSAGIVNRFSYHYVLTYCGAVSATSTNRLSQCRIQYSNDEVAR